MTTRREFLHTAAALAAFGAPAANVLGANETIHVACLGTGGRCRQSTCRRARSSPTTSSG